MQVGLEQMSERRCERRVDEKTRTLTKKLVELEERKAGLKWVSSCRGVESDIDGGDGT